MWTGSSRRPGSGSTSAIFLCAKRRKASIASIEAQSDALELSRLLKLAAVWNVTEAERLTIEYEELETPPAAGFVPRADSQFSDAGPRHQGAPGWTEARDARAPLS